LKFDVLDVNAAATDQRHYQRALWLVWLFAAIMVGLISWYVQVATDQDKQREFTTAANDLANLTRVSQEHANRTFRSADQVIRFVQDAYLKQGKALDLSDLTRRGVIDAEIFNQVGIIDSHGLYVLANRPVTGKLDLSDREHFRVHVLRDTGKLWVSKPVVGRATKRWSIQLTRRITRDDGSFAGVVVVSIDPTYFTRFYGDLNLGEHGEMVLLGLDGVARARKAGGKEEFGTSMADALVMRELGQGNQLGSYTSVSAADGIERLYQYRRIPGYDLAVLAGIGAQDLLAKHNQARNVLWQQAALLITLTLALAGLLARYLVNLRRVMLARKAAQDQVQERTEQLDAIFSLSPDGFVSFDQDKRVSYVNPAFTRLTDSQNIALQGLDERDFSSWLTTRCVKGHQFPGMAALRAKDAPEAAKLGHQESRVLIEIEGSQRRVLHVALRSQTGSAVSQILYLRDVTVEYEVDAMKSEFMVVAAHELRTPMTSILGYNELLLDGEHDAQTQREFLRIMLTQSRVMVSILDELLDLARIESRRGQDFRLTMVSVNDFMHDVVKALPVPEGRRPPALTLPLEPLFVMADTRKLQQAVMNVLTNAYKYSEASTEVGLHASSTTDQQGKSWVSIDVVDHGIGMTPEQAGRACERFYRADTSGRIPGTGLGMAITKEIMELQGGLVKIESMLGQGSRISLCLPRQ
jgi:signal transduction histidine kinase